MRSGVAVHLHAPSEQGSGPLSCPPDDPLAMPSPLARASLLASLLALTACHDGTGATGSVGPQPQPLQLGDPLPGLTLEERGAFERGRAIFSRQFRPSEGLGPLYNATSCESCHSKPIPGGSAELYRNFLVATYGVSPAAASNLPGLISPVVPAFGHTSSLTFTLDQNRLGVPETINGQPVRVAQRNSIPLFGVGMFEFVSNSTILANADPDDRDGDGISGRANNDAAGMGRFGIKAQSNNIEFFTRAPLMNQMGITTDPFRGSAGTVSFESGLAIQASSDPNGVTRDNDGAGDPELSARDLGDLIAFTRFLAPPQPRPLDSAAARGRATFTRIGCSKCHLPSLPSSRGPVAAFTDLLLHDMGSSLADDVSFGRPQASQNDPAHTASEFRTAPLWGVSLFGPYLHDGRAESLEEAIRLHGGEATGARVAYESLPSSDQEEVVTFLRHL